MRVFLTTAYPTPWTYLPRFTKLAEQDRYRNHYLVYNAAEADVILFVDARYEHGEWDFRTLRHHPLVRARPEACFVYDETDQPWCSMPGVYVSMPAAAMDRRRQRAGGYVTLINDEVAAAAAAVDDNGGPTQLFSFAGRDCHTIRNRILKFRHPRGTVEDTSGFNFFGDANRPPAEMAVARQRYASGIAQSKFVLCPRGTGTASFRLFETLAAGRVPVIISDDWMPVTGPNWKMCSVRVPEKKVDDIPELLEEMEPCWTAMAEAARTTWKEYFAPDVLWHRLVEACFDLQRQKRSTLLSMVGNNLFDRRYIRLWLRHLKASIKSPRDAWSRAERDRT